MDSVEIMGKLVSSNFEDTKALYAQASYYLLGCSPDPRNAMPAPNRSGTLSMRHEADDGSSLNALLHDPKARIQSLRLYKEVGRG